MTQASKLKDMKWRKIHAPTAWRPTEESELTGYYVGRTKKDGQFGQYEVMLVAVPYKGTYTISGTGLIQLCDSAQLCRGDAVRVKFNGRKQLTDEREVKLFELYVGELPMADDMPSDEVEIVITPEPS